MFAENHPYTWSFYKIFYAIIILHDVTFIFIPTRWNYPLYVIHRKIKVNYTCNLYEDEDDCKIEVDGSLFSVRPNLLLHDM